MQRHRRLAPFGRRCHLKREGSKPLHRAAGSREIEFSMGANDPE